MAHLTFSPFHRPSPSEMARTIQPLSPPETDDDSLAHLHGTVGEAEHADSSAADKPASRFRKIVYQQSGIKESRDRTIQRSSKFFIVVLPPPMIWQDHGHLGHTLSSGPQHRLSAGILMPLLSTVCYVPSHHCLCLHSSFRCIANLPLLHGSLTSRVLLASAFITIFLKMESRPPLASLTNRGLRCGGIYSTRAPHPSACNHPFAGRSSSI
jgi:hypothetical protein